MRRWSRHGRRRRPVVSTVVVCTLGLSVLAAPVAAVSNSGGAAVAAAAQPAGTQGDLVKLSQRVRELIRVVEASEAPCDIRNTWVRRLRLLDDALRSGQRTSASVLLGAWRARAERMVSARLLSASANEVLQQRLAAIQGEIGSGIPENPKPTRRWPKLPTCSATSAAPVGATSTTPAWDSNDTLTVITTALYTTGTRLGSLAAGIITLFWPKNTAEPDVTTIVNQAILDDALSDAATDVKGFTDLVNKFLSEDVMAWAEECGYDRDNPQPDWEPTPGCGTDTARHNVTQGWNDLTNAFILFMPHFQQNAGGVDYRTDLLPMYVQMENLYLAHLQLGIVNREAWWPGSPATQRIPSDLMNAQIETEAGDPPPDNQGGENDPDRVDLTGVGYVEDVYKLGTETERPVGTDGSGRLNIADWKVQNAWARDTGTIQGLYFSDTWPFMDPLEYPDGEPDYEQTRMIYSDPLGFENANYHYYRGPIPPANVSSPLSLLEVWQDNSIDYLEKQPVIDAVRVTAADGSTSPVMGDPTPEFVRFGWQIAPDDPTLAPVVAVHVAEGYESYKDAQANVHWPQGFEFTFADTGIGSVGSFSTTGIDGKPFQETKLHLYDYAYDGQILATAKVLDEHQWTDIWGNVLDTSADCAIFGFRFADSLY